jgi:hypothetical protein
VKTSAKQGDTEEQTVTAVKPGHSLTSRKVKDFCATMDAALTAFASALKNSGLMATAREEKRKRPSNHRLNATRLDTWR